MSFYDVVLHLDSADPAMLRLVMRNAMNYLNALPQEDFDLQIVANGGGVTHFTLEHEDLRDLVKPVAERGATVKLCANALAEHNISADELWLECTVVPAGLVEIVRLQRAGFAYIKP